jgi:SAM-dependent methyltransferase
VKKLGIGVVGQRILDLGTGTGTLACGFAERGCDVVGLDPSPEMLAQAAKTAGRDARQASRARRRGGGAALGRASRQAPRAAPRVPASRRAEGRAAAAHHVTKSS